jgi:hypothetical protein
MAAPFSFSPREKVGMRGNETNKNECTTELNQNRNP